MSQTTKTSKCEHKEPSPSHKVKSTKSRSLSPKKTKEKKPLSEGMLLYNTLFSALQAGDEMCIPQKMKSPADYKFKNGIEGSVTEQVCGEQPLT